MEVQGVLQSKQVHDVLHLLAELLRSLLEYLVVLLVEIDLAKQPLLRRYEVSDLPEPLRLLQLGGDPEVFKGLLHLQREFVMRKLQSCGLLGKLVNELLSEVLELPLRFMLAIADSLRCLGA